MLYWRRNHFNKVNVESYFERGVISAWAEDIPADRNGYKTNNTVESTIPSQTTNKRYSSIISSNQNVTNKSDIIHKPAIPPKPNNGLIASRLSKRRFEESRQKFKLKESKAKPKRKGNSLPVMSMTKLSANDKTQKSISVDCVNQRSSKQYSRQSQESLFQRFVKEASSSINVNSNKNVKRTGSDGVIITPHTVNRHTQFFPDNNGNPLLSSIDHVRRMSEKCHRNVKTNGEVNYMDKCENILQTANLEIKQAETLIENIIHNDDDEKVFEDIDKKIERLEQSQVQISEALKTFKTLKQHELAENGNTYENNNFDVDHQLSLSNINDELAEQMRRHSQFSSTQKLTFSLYDNQIQSKTKTMMKHSNSEYHSDSEFTIIPTISKNGRKVNKSKSFDILDSDINRFLSSCDYPEKFNNDSESFSNSLPSELDPTQQSKLSRSASEENILQQTNNESGNSFNSGDLDALNDSLENSSLLHPDDRKILYIAKEIMTSEKVYVDVLKLINIDFRNFIQDARKSSKSQIMPTEQFLKIFSNLPEIMMLNSELLRDFEERVQNWTQKRKISDIIVMKGPYLKLYTTYVSNYSTMTTHFEDCCEKFPKFKKLVKEFEKFPQCRNLKLTHYLLKPIQRLPQYKLLLEDYLKYLDVSSSDYDDTTIALGIVTEAAEHANETIKQMDKFHAMLSLQSRLGDYQIILPGRDLIKEGELLKISRKGTNARYFVLLSDCLLYCTSYSTSLVGASLRVSYNIPLDHLKISLPSSSTDNGVIEETDDILEFSITSNVRSCTLRARNINERNEWLEALHSAVEDMRSRKASFNKINDNEPIMDTSDGTQDILGDTCPVWVPDSHVTMCQECCVVFSLTVRRHHCRACGRVMCSQCTENKAPLRYNQFQAARVCDRCYNVLFNIVGNDSDLRSKFKQRNSNSGKTPKKQSIIAKDESQISGYLSLRQKNGKWKKAWYSLNNGVLYSYAGREDISAINSYNLADYPKIAGNGLVTFILRCSEYRDDCDDAEIEDELHFTTDSHTSRDNWVKAIIASNKSASLTDHFEL